MESIARLFSNLFDIKNWWSIRTEDLAKVMIKVAKNAENYNALNVFEHKDIVSMK